MINWEKIHDNFIMKHKNQVLKEGVYYEKHHIIPRHMGGNNNPENLIKLDLRQHTLIHYILFRQHRNLGNEIAYKMKSGQTEEGNKLRLKLAVENSIEISRKRWIENPPMKNPITKEKAFNTKRKKYNGNFFSEKGQQLLKDLFIKNVLNNPEGIKKAVETRVKNNQNRTKEERSEVYGRLDEKNGNFGKKRPDELAGNFGKSKGTYRFISPNNEIYEFSGIRKAMTYFGISDSTIHRYENKGKIETKVRSDSKLNLNSWEIIYIINENYGLDNKTSKEKFLK
jgi:hypothetical protein